MKPHIIKSTAFIALSLLIYLNCSEQPHQINGEAFLVRTSGDISPAAGIEVYVAMDTVCSTIEPMMLCEALGDPEVTFAALPKQDIQLMYERLNVDFKNNVIRVLDYHKRNRIQQDEEWANDYLQRNKLLHRYIDGDMSIIFDKWLNSLAKNNGVASRWIDEGKHTSIDQRFSFMLHRLKTLYALSFNDTLKECSSLKNLLQMKHDQIMRYKQLQKSALRFTVGIDGKFTFSIPDRGSYHLIAAYEDAVTQGLWFVPVSVSREDKIISVSLNNKNFIQTVLY
jgi:hypothetical protein